MRSHIRLLYFIKKKYKSKIKTKENCMYTIFRKKSYFYKLCNAMRTKK